VDAPNLGWKNVFFVNKKIKQLSYEIYLGQDTKAAALAEYLFGAGKDCKNIVCVTLGTGIGAGIIINGKVYFGSFGTSGELGHMIVKLNGNKCKCGKRGCLEAHASGAYLSQEARKIIGESDYLEGNTKKNLNEILAEDIFLLANEGNKKAIRIINKVIKYIGIGLVNILNILGPEKIIISGGLSKQKGLVDKLDKFVKKNGYTAIANKVDIVKAELGEYAPLIGAAMLYHDKSFKYMN
jgi:glucokinase